MDRKILLLINQQWTSPALDRVMAVLSSFDLWAPLLVVALLLLAWRGPFATRACLLVAVLAAGVTDGLVCNPLKHLVGRPRPHQALAGIRQVDLAKAKPRLLAVAQPARVSLSNPREESEGRSFPSSHAANTMSAAMVAALFFPRRGWLALAIPLAVGYSRVYTGAHWPSDVAGSLLLGAVLGLLVALGAAAVWKRFALQWWPHLQATHPQLLSS